jgi:hypothetical protein
MTSDAILARLNTGIDIDLPKNANRCSPQLIQELTHAIVACERSPLLPDEIEELCEIVAEAGSLRLEVRKIKDDLPFLLRTSSAEKLLSWRQDYGSARGLLGRWPSCDPT